MKVESLMQAIELRDDKSMHALLGEMTVAADCSSLTVNNPVERVRFPWDEQTERAIATYLDVPKTYLHRLDQEFRAVTVNHLFRTHERADTVIDYITRDGEDQLIALQRPDRPVMPLHTIGEIVQRVFDPQDDVITLLRDESRFHIDVATSHTIEVPAVEDIPDRRVGDITRGGVRILATPFKSTPPVVQGYFDRLVCTNGMCSPRDEGTIALRGNTLPQVIDELEIAARRILGGMQERLNEYASLATKRIPGNPATFAYRIAEEAGLGARATERIMARVGALPADHPEISLYDVANVFTEIAQSGRGVSYSAQIKMQEAAGEMAFATEAVVARCHACEKKL